MAFPFLAVDEQRLALAFALAEKDPTHNDGSDAVTEHVVTGFMDYGDNETAYAEDFMREFGAPGCGCRLELELGLSELDVGLAIADAAQWSVPEVGATQDGFCHAGYRGTVEGLLRKAAKDVEMMRSGYPVSQQPLFDDFLGQVQSVLDGQASDQGIKMVIRDPSGLSCVATEPVEWVKRSYFPRSFREVEALGLVPSTIPQVPSEQHLKTSDEIAMLIRKARRVVAFTGAGASVESGITPFRTYGTGQGGENGSIWGTFDAAKMTNANFNNDLECAKAWWAMKHSLYKDFQCAKPNPAHMFFAHLHKEGKLAGIVTQNIDSLHTRAGVPPEKVLEIHGHMRGLICSDKATDLNPMPFKRGCCTFEMTEEEASARGHFASEELPVCPLCSCPLRTQTVMFGQPMPRGAIQGASDLVASADLLVVIGSTLIVAPANELPGVALINGCPVVIINFDDTHYDQFATGLVRKPAGEFLAEVTSKLGLGFHHADHVAGSLR